MRLANFKADQIDQNSLNQINLKIDSACIRYSRGRNSMMADAATAGAIIRLGRSVLINAPKMDKYYSELAGE
ncbi:MAG: DUF6462 family protein [Clostridiales bacterium]|nr:DUF6462 family protein [Clostridiales bacterium]